MLDFLERVATVPGYEEPLAIQDDGEVQGDGEVDGWSWEKEEEGVKEAQAPFISPVIAAAFA